MIDEVRKILMDFSATGTGRVWDRPLNELVDMFAQQICQLFEPKLTPAMRFELEGTKPEYQDRLAELLNFASAMGDYGDPHGSLAVISPDTEKVLLREGEKIR